MSRNNSSSLTRQLHRNVHRALTLRQRTCSWVFMPTRQTLEALRTIPIIPKMEMTSYSSYSSLLGCLKP